MGLERLRTLLALPVASLFLILLVCVFALQQPMSMGVRIPIMRLRPVALSNCELNGFTVRLRPDGSVIGSEFEGPVAAGTILQRIKNARGDVQDQTIFVIADPNVEYGKFVELIADIHDAAPPDHIAVVTHEAQIMAFQHPSAVLADRCRFEWPALKGQPKWLERDPIPLPPMPK